MVKSKIDVKKLCKNLEKVLSGMKRDGYDLDDAINEILSECPEIGISVVEDVAEKVWNK